MNAKPLEIYQGSDWLTYRWSVAQAFDTLDRIRDLCLQTPLAAGLAGMAPSGQPRYELPEEDIADVFGYITELCDDLVGEMDAVQADLLPLMQRNLAHRWFAFEMRLHLDDLRARAAREAETPHPGQSSAEGVVNLAARIKTLLKQIDQ